MRLILCILTAIGIATWLPQPADADDQYVLDPVVQKLARSVDVPIAAAGGHIDIPDSDGVVAQITYPANDACPTEKLGISALGPKGVERSPMLGFMGLTDMSSWHEFYIMSLSFRGCTNDFITFTGFPSLTLGIAPGQPGSIYFLDLIVQQATTASIPIGRPDEETPAHLVFDFSDMPPWSRPSDGVRVPVAPTISLIAVRQ